MELSTDQLRAILIAKRGATKSKTVLLDLEWNILKNVHPKSVSRQLSEARKTYISWVREKTLPSQAGFILKKKFSEILDSLPQLKQIVESVLEQCNNDALLSSSLKRGLETETDDERSSDDEEGMLGRRKRKFHRKKRRNRGFVIGNSDSDLEEPFEEPQSRCSAGTSSEPGPSGASSKQGLPCSPGACGSTSTVSEPGPSGTSSKPGITDVECDPERPHFSNESMESRTFEGQDESTSALYEEARVYMENCKPNYDVKIEFEEFMREHVSTSKQAQFHVTKLFKRLKKYQPKIDYDRLPTTCDTLMKKGKKDMKKAEIFTIYVDESKSNVKQVRKKIKKPVKRYVLNNEDIEDEPGEPDVSGRVVQESSSSDDVNLTDDEKDKPKRNHEFDERGRRKRIAGKYAHFGLESGIFGESIGN